jgi:hypothetical protein
MLLFCNFVKYVRIIAEKLSLVNLLFSIKKSPKQKMSLQGALMLVRRPDQPMSSVIGDERKQVAMN